ncbi:signal peptidase II [Paenibacillus sp. WQ 127069]|uniref:Lipoprotein signal peptidase n=1 Tax=Paenibacillus baimaensis TaxID=2982185 RepID=A0ABT2UPZ7_9BACL|nr:signal peptidase II [Paenibacillus sp. WQ 127069]MCU6796131.1 signal peptidase II [Paenibacillus sp. WQ 127069]
MLFYIIAAIVMIIDQASKRLVRLYMELGESIPVHRLLQFTYIENDGMARGLFPGYARLFALVAVLFVAGILYYRKKGELRGTLMDIGTGFMVGGAVGNAIDRIVLGTVTDFLAFGSGRGVMNIADLAINIGVLFMIIAMIQNYVSQKSKSEHVNEG